MDFNALNSALSNVSSYDSIDSIPAAVSMKMLDNTMELNEEMSQDMIKMMERSVNPHLGSNMDVYV